MRFRNRQVHTARGKRQKQSNKQLPNIRVFARQIPRFSEILNELAVGSITFLLFLLSNS
jgi:hypothetical protein